MKKKKTFKKKGKGRNPSVQLVSQIREDDAAVTEDAAAESAEDEFEIEEDVVTEEETAAAEPQEEPEEETEEEPEEQPAQEQETVTEDTAEKAEEAAVTEAAATQTPDSEEPEQAAEVREEVPAAPVKTPVRRGGHGYWIHHRVKAEGSMSGYFYLSTCDCSVCGYTANMEKKVCHSCGAIMDLKAPEETL